MFRKGIRSFSLFRNSDSFRILQFQSGLLRNIALTTESEKNWRKHVLQILSDASELISVAFLFVYHVSEHDKRNLDIFWISAPSESVKSRIEEQVKRKIGEKSGGAASPVLMIYHASATGALSLPELSEKSIEFHINTLPLNTSCANGCVGLCLTHTHRRERIRETVIAGTLAAVSGIVSSVRTLSTLRSEAERFATRDPLTNLYNQIACWDLLEYETSRASRQAYKFSLLVLDLDNFKTINDTYGHETGDDFLKEFSDILRNSVRSGDIAARYAGDQFAAILPVCDEGQAYIVAKRILDNLRDYSYTLPNGTGVKGTVSIGVAVFPDHAKDAKDLFLLADNMHTQAKSAGKDRISMPSEQDNVEFLKSMGEKNIMILEALAQKRIIPYFQPIMNVRDRSIAAYEVLTRISLPDRVVAASEFIETAEGMGAIGRLDYQLFEHALARTRDAKYDGDLFINLSPKVLVLNEFMPRIKKMMRDYGVEPTKLIFEITERDTVKNLALVNTFIKELKQDGFRFAIDDFGAGYSSFQYIKTFCVDYIKVDGEFIRHMTGNGSTEQHIVTSIANLACHLGIKSIAEYVESENVLNQVSIAGIDYAQGYYIQRPSPDLG